MTVESIRDDLDRLIVEAMWAHTHGYSKAGRGLDAERGADLSKTEEEREKGPTYDLTLGDHNSRVAYQAAVRAVSRSDQLVAAMLLPTWRYQPQVEPLGDYAFPTYLQRAVTRLRWRLDRVDEETHKTRLRRVDKAIRRALDGLLDVLGDSKLYTAHKDNPCRTCKIRPAALRAKADGTTRVSKAGECDVCAQFRFRHGVERPTDKDRDSINQARAAQARRRARGEDFGAA